MKAPAQSHPASKCKLTSLKNNPESVPGQLRWLRTAAECHKTTHLRGVGSFGGFEPASGLRTRKQRRTAQFLDLYAKLVTATCIQLGECSTFLANLAPTSRQLLATKSALGRSPYCGRDRPLVGP
jgi:hypothetical protein